MLKSIIEWVNEDTKFLFEGELVYHVKGLNLFRHFFIGVFTLHDDNIFIIGELEAHN